MYMHPVEFWNPVDHGKFLGDTDRASVIRLETGKQYTFQVSTFTYPLNYV